MKVSCALLLLAGMTTTAFGQGFGSTFQPRCSRPPVYYRPATSSQAGLVRAQAERIRAAGEYNLNTAAAARTLQEARAASLENDLRKAEVFWKKRELHRSQAESDKSRNTPAETSVRSEAKPVSHRIRPTLIDPGQEGFAWPAALNHPDFAQSRELLSALFAERAAQAGLGSMDLRIRDICSGMRSQLAELIRELPPMDYVEARNFLNDLIHEASLPSRGEVART